MDPLSVSASALTLAHLANKLYGFAEAAYRSEEEKEKLTNEFNNLKILLQQLQVLEKQAQARPDDGRYETFRSIVRSSTQSDGKAVPDATHEKPGILDQLKTAMEKTESELAPQRDFKARIRQSLWYHDRKEPRGLIKKIKQWSALVTQVINVDTNMRVRVIEDKADDAAKERDKKALEKRRIHIVVWLSTLRFRERQSALLNQEQVRLRKPSLLTSEEYEMWEGGRPWILHCHGMPGSGKTLLCAATVKHLQETFKDQDIPILCIYLNYKEQYQLDNLIASLLKQLIQRRGAEFRSSEAKRLYQGVENESRPSLEEFFSALCAELEAHDRAFIVVDALDEAEARVKTELLGHLYTLVGKKTSVMMTSQRPEDSTYLSQCNGCQQEALKVYYRCPICDGGFYYLCQECIDKDIHCRDEEHELLELRTVSVDIEPSADEVRNYVIAELEAEQELGFSHEDNYSSTLGTTPLGRLLKSQPGLKTDILDSVVAKANGMYALAGLYMNSLRSFGLSEAEILEMLESAPEGYQGFYEQYMQRICAGRYDDPYTHAASPGRRILSWVACAKRHLSLSELQDALAVNLKKQKPGIFNPAARYDKATIVSATAGLVTVDNDGMSGNEAVRLNHFSAQQYFDEHRERWFPQISAEITKVALHYLSIKQLSEPCGNDWEDKHFEMRKIDYPFLEYAYEYWGDHAAEASSDLSAQITVMQFLSDPNKIAAFIQAAWYLRSDATAEWDIRKGANGLHVAAWFGITYAVSTLVGQGLDVNSIDPKYAQTALMYACRRGQTAMVAMLLERGADMNMYSTRGCSAIHEAVSGNNLGALELLLRNSKTNVNALHHKKSGMTPLAIAVKESDPDIAMALVNHDSVDINLKDLKCRTALSHAIEHGRVEVALYILNRHNIGLDLNSRDWKGYTALISAAESGMVDLVDSLLNEGADPSVRDSQGGGTAILRATDEGHLSIVKIMLDRGVDINCLDDERRGLLHAAALGGWNDIVKLLLDRGLNPNLSDAKGRIPLHDASRMDHLTTVQLLLDHGATLWLKDRSGRIPWTVAWQNGHERVLEVLGSMEPYEPTEQDLAGEYPNAAKLPVWSLARLGMEQLVAQAIAEKRDRSFSLDPDSGNTALHWAVRSQELEIVKMLVSVGMSASAKNDYLQTPLHLAASGSSLEIVKSLLESDSTDEEVVTSGDKWCTPPIEYAYDHGNFKCCLLFIKAGATIPPSNQARKQFYFFLAVEYGDLDAVINLVNMGADIQAKNVLGMTGIQLAQAGGKKEIEKFLRKEKSFWVDGLDSETAREGEMVASLSLKQSPFHKPEIWDEEEKEEEDMGKEGVIVATGINEESRLQHLSGIDAPTNDFRSNRPLLQSAEETSSEAKPGRVLQLC